MKQPHFRISPIGGVGEIGANMTLVKSKSVSFIIDCGILFPSDDCFGVNYLIPNTDDLKKPDFLFITHGHEDHIGAIIHFINLFPGVPIYAPKFARELIFSKLERAKISAKVHLYERDAELNFTNLLIKPIQLNHSIPDTYGVYIKDTQENISLFYASDFKIDSNNPYGESHQLDVLKRISKDDKLKYLFPDSTNLTSSKTKATSETELIQGFEKLFKTNKRIFVTTFSSNIFRMKTIIKTALSNNRKVVLHGRSTNHYFEIASKLGYFEKPELKSIIDAKSVKRDQKNIVVIVSGCQGDFKSALRRVSFGEDKNFKLSDDDLFIFSSKNIPGSEKKVMFCINKIITSGAQVVTASDELIHATGHACLEDLSLLYDSYNPNYIVPIHGEDLFLKKHNEFIKKNNSKGILLRNNMVLDILESGPRVIDSESKEMQLVCGDGIITDRSIIRDRRKLAQNGLIQIIRNKKDITVNIMGIYPQAKIFSEELASDFLNLTNTAEYEEKVRVLIRQRCQAEWGIKPIVMISVNL